MSGSKPSALAGLDVAVLAGGLGTRLRTVLDDRPKILAPVSGRPFLDHLLEALAAVGATRVVFCLGHMADQVIAHLQGGALPLAVDWVVEPAPLGTAGALRFVRPKLRGSRVLVINGDTWLGFDLTELVARFDAGSAAGALVYTEVPDVSRYGRLELDADGYVAAFREKDPARGGPGIINGGVYLLSATLLDQLAAGGAASLEQDFLEKLPPGSLMAYRAGGPFIDIGTPESLAGAADVVERAVFGRAK